MNLKVSMQSRQQVSGAPPVFSPEVAGLRGQRPKREEKLPTICFSSLIIQAPLSAVKTFSVELR